jgi:hypothetical protein
VRLSFHQRTKIKRSGLMPWSPYQVVCSCGFKGRHRLTKEEAEVAAKAHWKSKHGNGALG